jgi:hypothetical protein
MSFKRRQLTNAGYSGDLTKFWNWVWVWKSGIWFWQWQWGAAPQPLENPESEDPLSTYKVLVPFEDACGDGGRPIMDEVQEFCGSWKSARHFTPLALLFALMSPSLECNGPCHFHLRQCLKLFLTEELVGDISEPNRYALELQGATTIGEMSTFLVTDLLCHSKWPVIQNKKWQQLAVKCHDKQDVHVLSTVHM